MLLLVILTCVTSLSLNAHYIYRDHSAFNRPTPVMHLKNNPDLTSFHVGAQGYGRHAHEAFTNSLTSKKTLSSLYFGDDSFRLSHIFGNCYAPLAAENYNPYMRIIKIKPRVQYNESGVQLSAKVERAFGTKRKCRAGLGISAPFMRRTITRNDKGTRGAATTEDVVRSGDLVIYTRDGDGNLDGNAQPYQNARAFRLDFIEALPRNPSFDENIQATEAGTTTIFGSGMDRNVGDTIGGALIKKDESQTPKGAELGIYDAPLGETNAQTTEYLTTDISATDKSKIYEFETGIDYTSMLDAADKTVAQRVADQDAKAQLWLVGTYSATEGTQNSESQTINTLIDYRINQYPDNIYEWLNDRNFAFEDTQAIGFGDTTVQAYVQCPTSDHAAINLASGMILPTAKGSLDTSNPYTLHLGNRGHFEWFALAEFVVEIPRSIVCLSTNVRFAGVLPNEETVVARPQGSLIYNIGTPTKAEVSWYSLSGETWMHFRHPQTDDLSFSIGYNWYSKSKDTIVYKENSVESWLGKLYDTDAKAYTTANPITLDADTAAANTSAIAHTIRGQMACTLSDWFTINGGCSYVIAGKNTPATLEFSLGCSITY